MKKKKIEDVVTQKEESSNFFKYYKNELMRKNLLFYILALVIFFITFTIALNGIDFKDKFLGMHDNFNINTLIIEGALVTVVSVVIGVIPYANLSVLGILYSFKFAFNIVNMFYTSTTNKMLLSILIIVELFTICFAATLGNKICDWTTSVIKNRRDKKTNIKAIPIKYLGIFIINLLVLIALNVAIIKVI